MFRAVVVVAAAAAYALPRPFAPPPLRPPPSTAFSPPPLKPQMQSQRRQRTPWMSRKVR